MPKQEIDGDGVFNLALAIVGLVLQEGGIEIAELAKHFNVSEKAIAKAVHAITNSEDLTSPQSHFYLDFDSFDDGIVAFNRGSAHLDQAPVLSRYQQTSLAIGLEYLASLPEFSSNKELTELRAALSGGVTQRIIVNANLNLDQLAILRDAILSAHRVEFDYINQLGKRSHRSVDPLRIDLVGNKHYLRGYCLDAKELRSFRIERTSNLSDTKEPISKEATQEIIPDEVYGTGLGEVVEIAADPAAAEIFWNFPVEGQLTKVDGRTHGFIKVGNIAAIARHVVRYGGAVEVIAPPAARHAVRDFAARSLDGEVVTEE
jgi:proteasome accessory factor C